MSQSLTDSQTSVIALETLAEQTLALYRQHQEREKRRQADQTRQKDQQMAAALRALLETELESDLLAVLSVRYVTQHRERNETQTEAVFTYAGLDWHLSQEIATRQPTDWSWVIRAAKVGSGWYQHELTTHAAPLTLRTTLLLKLGECLEKARQEAQEAAAQEQRQIQAEADERAEDERKERERAARLEAADQEDARLRGEINALVEQAKSTMWRWPRGVTICIYRVSYNTAIGRGEEGESVVEQESGWTSTDHLDEAGYIRLEATKPSFWSAIRDACEIKLDPATHMPIWKRLTISSVNDLPSELCEEITVSMPHVVSRYSDLDEKCRLVQVEEYGYDEHAYQEHVGLIPLPWIRALVQATQEAR
ncbi:MAG TPA: hypothetical protein VFA10_27345 [Ktedonobacteraceae bacterium]|nr:hypothetical protein [Ktedonobacteraceae bacterium]